MYEIPNFTELAKKATMSTKKFELQEFPDYNHDGVIVAAEVVYKINKEFRNMPVAQYYEKLSEICGNSQEERVAASDSLNDRIKGAFYQYLFEIQREFTVEPGAAEVAVSGVCADHHKSLPSNSFVKSNGNLDR